MKKMLLPVLLSLAFIVIIALAAWQGTRLSALERTLEET